MLPDEPPEPERKRRSWRTVRFVALAVGAAAVLATVVLPRFDGLLGSASPAGSPGPTFSLPAALDAQVDETGLMRSGGIWAVQGSYLLTSTDNGGSWRAGTFPSPREPATAQGVFVLDPNHAWTIESDVLAGGVPSAGPAPAGQLLVVDRTSDGGLTWLSAPVSGDFGCETATLSFVDADHGFLMCAPRSDSAGGAGASATKGSGTVLRTDDGGATWTTRGGGSGLGPRFTASDASTLWSAPDYGSPVTAGAALYGSRDAGRTWSSVTLPDLASVPQGARASVAAGPVFWDASNGAYAVAISPVASSVQPAMWFYRTSDAGRSWTVAKEPLQNPVSPLEPGALVGRVWAAVGTNGGLFGLSVSTDFGASWQDVPGFGMPESTAFDWLDFIDKDHAAATVFADPGTTALMLSGDGGRTWHAANFGDARARVPANPAQDAIAARNTAVDFATMAAKQPQTAWRLLSSYSQRAFGSYAAFQTAQAAFFKRVDYTSTVGEPSNGANVLNQTHLGPGVWDDVTAFADMTRAHVVVVAFPGYSDPPWTLVLAPLTINGDWRVWLATTP